MNKINPVLGDLIEYFGDMIFAVTKIVSESSDYIHVEMIVLQHTYKESGEIVECVFNKNHDYFHYRIL